MNAAYRETVKRLFALQFFGVKLGLSNITRLLNQLGDPIPAKTTVLVAGTNGKGSVSAMLASIGKHAGLRTGLFTSPHLVSFTERIQINGERIKQEEVVSLCERLWNFFPNLPQPQKAEQITFFEMLTAMGILYFQEQHVDLGVFEAGLGGRLDATNILKRDAVVLTDIAFDHVQYLGNTVAQIVAEKAALMRAGIPVIASGGLPGVNEHLEAHATEFGAQLYLLGRDFAFTPHGSEIEVSFGSRRLTHLPVPLKGEHQYRNAALAVMTAMVLGIEDDTAIRSGLAATVWPGRLELFPGEPSWLLDCAHNPAGAETLAAALEPHDPTIWLVGMMADKDVPGVLRVVAPRVSAIVCTNLKIDRAIPAVRLGEFAAATDTPTHVEPEIEKAIEKARQLAGPHGRILVAGSIYLVGHIRGYLTGETGP